ncbi:T9SS type A sorting domain-containing protein [Limibacter armeniacum]|uniref:T9SS type A sorting domain-containing protein n=1 Tax=Limibacter armeniacum TaxID=466084 RepID=UPI002FE50609
MTNTFSRSLFVFACLLITSTSFSQQIQRCITDEVHQQLIDKKQAVDMQLFSEWLSKKSTNLRTTNEPINFIKNIPVIVHVVHNGESVGQGSNISEEQVISQLHALNQDYNRLNPDATQTPSEFRSVASNTGIEFKLAVIDPDGNLLSEPGIHRMKGSRADWGQSTVESELMPNYNWDADHYLNIWVVNMSNPNFLGLAFYPTSEEIEGLGQNDGLDFSTSTRDGVIIHYEVFGNNRDGEYPNLRTIYDLGRTTTHEVGHWLGLLHTWGASNGCNNDDYCDDTPLISESNSNILTNCNVSASTCAEESNFESAMFQNFMDYTGDACMNLFTDCQRVRMMDVLEFARPSIGAGVPQETPALTIDASGNTIELSWTTSTEANVVYVLERSLNNYDFEVVTFGKGFSSYNDAIAEADQDQYFYRVYAVNQNGFSKSSNIANVIGRVPDVIVGIEDGEISSKDIQVYPNPATNKIINIISDAVTTEACLLEIFDLRGQSILSQYSNSDTPFLNETLDVSALRDGIYLLRVSNRHGTATKKIMVGNL